MTFIPKPKVHHPDLPRNELGLTTRDYEGALSTLCAGCGHDSITAAIVQSCFELSLPPHSVAKTSGIGCSSKTPAYFLGPSHGFNSVHGRMPSITTGANVAHRGLTYLGVSGDGDTGSIGIGQFIHAMRRNLNMLYIIENNGVYGLTKGQFSATADVGSTTKKGEANTYMPLDPVLLGIQMGAGFIAQSFSGDKAQLVPLIKAGLKHKGFSLINVISPCVTFNNHEGSTKSYDYMRDHDEEVTEADYVPHKQEIAVSMDPGSTLDVKLHDGSHILLRKLDKTFDPTDRVRAMNYIEEHKRQGEILTGLLYIDSKEWDLHDNLGTVDRPLRDLPYAELCPGSKGLASVMDSGR